MSPISPLFTDLYQLTMVASYRQSRKYQIPAVFELFFRNCPFDGEYAVFSGYDRVREILENFKFSSEDIQYLRTQESFAGCSEDFFQMLMTIDLRDVELHALSEGELCFARLPLLQVRGPLWKLQLLESALLNAVNFSTLVSTYARRIRLVAGDRKLIEFGMRRAQGPDGAMTATRASFLGGFDGTSNVYAAKKFAIPCVGTMAHSFVQSFTQESLAELLDQESPECRQHFLAGNSTGNLGELASFISYAKTFPHRSLLLVDTYDTIQSGLPNAIRVFEWMRSKGVSPGGIRLDSGDLVYLSKRARQMLDEAGFSEAKIFASNDLSEDVIDSLIDQGAQIDAYGIGTHLVTCQDQPALGGVYKLVELNGEPRLKISQQTEKLVLPAAKKAYRLFGKDGRMLLDYLCLRSEPAPQVGQEVFALHPTDPLKRVKVIPSQVEELLRPIFKHGRWLADESLEVSRNLSLKKMELLREDIQRRKNPAAYKVSISPALKDSFQKLFEKESPPMELR
jgi:nicotinate phosphoribosyltransferase